MSEACDNWWGTGNYSAQRISDEDIAYIREWAASGNGLRWFPPGTELPVRAAIYAGPCLPTEEYRLNATGITIAALADELESLKKESEK